MTDLYILVKPAADLCNLSCRYCFYKDVAKNHKNASHSLMTEDTLEHLVKKAVSFANRQLVMVFQGGEPTVAGLEFYKNLVALQRKYNTKGICIQNHIQTNGYSLDKEWAKFFADNQFFVGLSFDGIPRLHDKNRVTLSGKPTSDKILASIHLLKTYNVNFNVLTVVTDEIAENIEEIYAFYKEHDLQFQQYIPFVPEFGKEATQLDSQKYGVFLKRLFDLWYEDMMRGEAVYNRYFDNLAARIAGLKPECCGMDGYCQTQLVVEADGTIFPCDFYVLDEYAMGNINQDGFDQIIRSCNRNKFIEESFVIDPSCEDCAYLDICRGGCRRYRQLTVGSPLKLNYLCSAYKEFFDYGLLRMEKLIREKSDIALDKSII